MDKVINVIAEIKLFSGVSMRKTPFGSGYRPLFDFPNTETKISGNISLLNSELFYPGESGLVKVTFIDGMIKRQHFSKGNKFNFGEGMHALGEGEIMEVIVDE